MNMTTVGCIIDYREHKLIDILTKLSVQIEVQTLEIGDIHIYISQQEKENIVFVFERKTVRDLAASIKDGRYREQKMRMSSTYLPHQCTYIIENSTKSVLETSEMGESIYHGALMHTMYRDHMHVVIVQDVQETARYIAALFAKMQEHPEKFISDQVKDGGGPSYLDTLKVKKRKIDNIDPKTCYLMQWCQIPGISHKIAQEIVKEYPSWHTFYDTLAKCSTDKERIGLLQQIPMLGIKKAKLILEYVSASHTNDIKDNCNV